MLLACAGSRDLNIVRPMFSPLARRLAVALGAAFVPACTQDNPWFVPVSDESATTASVNPTTGSEPGPTTSEPGSGSGSDSMTGPTTSGALPGTTTSHTASTGEPADTSTGEPVDTSTSEPADTSSSTGPAEPMEELIEVPATLATCVLLPIFNLNLLYIGPAGCEMLAAQFAGNGEIGVMVLDKAFIPASSRESRVYVSFAIPAAPPGKDLLAATLVLEASASLDAGAAWSGDLFLSDAFNEFSLKTLAPGGIPLVPNPGPAAPGQPSYWQIPLNNIVPNQTLYLGLGAIDTDGVLYRSNGAGEDKKPRLKLIYK